MKHIFIPLLVAMVLTSCNEESTSSNELDQERRRRAEAEQRATESEESRDRWQTFTVFTAAGAVVLLFVGAALGSKAKDDVRRN